MVFKCKIVNYKFCLINRSVGNCAYTCILIDVRNYWICNLAFPKQQSLPWHTCARSKVIMQFVSLLLLASKWPDLEMYAPRWANYYLSRIKPLNMAKNWLGVALHWAILAMRAKNMVLWSHLSTTPTADHVLSAHVRTCMCTVHPWIPIWIRYCSTEF